MVVENVCHVTQKTGLFAGWRIKSWNIYALC